MSSKPEPYLPPKELSAKVEEQVGLPLNVKRIYSIRQQSEAARDGTFLDGRATVSGIVEWLKEHPEFVHRPS